MLVLSITSLVLVTATLVGRLFGYYNKTQNPPKPVYTHNRVVLGRLQNDYSMESFISANEVYPGLILTQCPMAVRTDPAIVSTIEDVKRMIIQQNIALWVQIAPSLPDGGALPHIDPHIACSLFPLEFFANSTHPHSVGISNFRISTDTSSTFKKFTYQLTAYSKILPSGKVITQFPLLDSLGYNHDFAEDILNVVEDGSGWHRQSMSVEHYWLHSWEDFQPPRSQDTEAILNISIRAADILSMSNHSKRVAINCLSGRGRSGTFAALVVGHLNNLSSVSAMVDVVVSMRESRDSVIETPEQFQFVVRALSLDASPGLQKKSWSGEEYFIRGRIFESMWMSHALAFFVGVFLTTLFSVFWRNRSAHRRECKHRYSIFEANDPFVMIKEERKVI